MRLQWIEPYIIILPLQDHRHAVADLPHQHIRPGRDQGTGFNAVIGREVLTLHRDYFRLEKPPERGMYELARKHCGKQDEWVISLEMLKKKCGSASEDYEFRRLVNIVCAKDQA
jgi:plasmid replication initiation protein